MFTLQPLEADSSKAEDDEHTDSKSGGQGIIRDDLTDVSFRYRVANPSYPPGLRSLPHWRRRVGLGYQERLPFGRRRTRRNTCQSHAL